MISQSKFFVFLCRFENWISESTPHANVSAPLIVDSHRWRMARSTTTRTSMWRSRWKCSLINITCWFGFCIRSCGCDAHTHMTFQQRIWWKLISTVTRIHARTQHIHAFAFVIRCRYRHRRHCRRLRLHCPHTFNWQSFAKPKNSIGRY